jgi:BolA protein
MTRKERIQAALAALSPEQLEVIDESHRHGGGSGRTDAAPDGAAHESHYNVVMVSSCFDGSTRIERHRRVHEILAAELATGLHALTLTLRTPAEQAANGKSIASPSCLGGSKSA